MRCVLKAEFMTSVYRERWNSKTKECWKCKSVYFTASVISYNINSPGTIIQKKTGLQHTAQINLQQPKKKNDLVIKMRNLSEITMNHFEHHWKPRRWSRFPYFWSEAGRTHRSHSSPALLQWGQNIFQTNGMLTGWFHGPTHLLWFIRQACETPFTHLPKKGKTSISLERKTNECHLKTHVHGSDSQLCFSKVPLLIIIWIRDTFAEESLCSGS